ncbi:MAG: phosphatidylglycerol lysyltransferase domain-containing protein, partial [Candidatus Eremiobacterota bacterium]
MWKSIRAISFDIWNIRAVSLLTAVMGIINIISAITPVMAVRLALIKSYLPLEIRHGGRLSATLAGFGLLLLSGQLWRRKRVAWFLTVILLIISVCSHIIKGLDYEEAMVATIIIIWLLALRHNFHASSDRPSVKHGLMVVAFSVIFTLIYGITGFYLLDRHFSVNFGLIAAVKQTVIMFIEFYDPGLEPVTGFGKYFADSIYLVGLITLSYSVIMLFRPVLIREPATEQEREKAKSIVEAYGKSALSRLTLLDDKSFYFSHGNSVISYVTSGGTALVLGDPIGPEEDIPKIIKEFQELCSKNDWKPAFFQTLPDNLEHYKNAGFRTLCIGQEAIVNLETFTLKGKAGKDLRPPLNKLTKLGYRAELHKPPLTDTLIGELKIISDEWLTMMHGTEKKFTLGWFDYEYIKNCPVMAVHGPEGDITAFANIIPIYSCNQSTIDLMRRKKKIENGTMDFLFISLLEWARENGNTGFSLGLCPFTGIE